MSPLDRPEIVELRAERLDELVRLERRVFPEEAWTEPMLRGHLRRVDGLALGAGAPLSGVALGWVAGDLGELMRIGVQPEARGSGLGARLLGAFHERAAALGARELWLEVRADNAAAIRLYERFDYRPTGRRRRYYPDGTDALLMGCRLPRTGG